MQLTVFSSKTCWPSKASPSGYATDGGFAFQMQALSELFDSTNVVVPVDPDSSGHGEVAISGRNLRIVALPPLRSSGMRRKLELGPWLLRCGPRVIGQVRSAGAIHAPIPADIGTIGMLLGYAMGKPLFVRYCGNWGLQRTAAERFWRWFMESIAGGRNVMLATGGDDGRPPSEKNQAVQWIFSTTMTGAEMAACRRVRHLTPGSARLITVARQEAGKGTDLLIRSLPRIQQSLPQATLEVVGGGGALAGLQALAGACGLNGSVVFTGRLSHEQVLERLRHSDLFCYPTASEGFPKAVLEALACGLPVVTTPVSVLSQLVEGCGVLLPERSEHAVENAVLRCLRDPDEYHSLSQAAVRRAGDYSLERWRDAIGSILRQSWGPLHQHV